MSENVTYLSEKAAVPALTDGAPLHVKLSENDHRFLEVLGAPGRTWFSPVFHGLDKLPAEGPVLLVGNHTLAGGLDAPMLAHEILRRTGRLPRGLAENVLIDVPGLRDFLQHFGIVRGNRHNCTTLLRQGEVVAVFPGGGREAMSGKHEKYVLDWRGRTGFARMAIETGVPIVPMGMVGGDDVYDVVFDGAHPAMRPVRGLVKALGLRASLTPPLIRGLGPTWLPKPERFYFSLGDPIDTSAWTDASDKEEAAHELQGVVRKSLEEELKFLLAARDADRGRSLLGRAMQAIDR